MPGKLSLILGILPFIVLIGGYLSISHQRLSENPRDKLTPGISEFAKGWEDSWKLRVDQMVDYTVKEGDTLESVAQRFAGDETFAERIRPSEVQERPLVPGEEIKVPTTERRIIVDTISSLKRLVYGMGIGVSIAIILGLAMGAFTPVEGTFYYIVTALAKIPPLAILPIIFILMGVGEWPKVTIIALGIAPTLTLDVLLRAKDIPRELIVKAYTLGASTPEIVFKVILANIWPHVLNSIRLTLGPAWVFLIAAEAIAADSGLGYRIFVVQRQLGMNIILLYVVWIMALGVAMDTALRIWISKRYQWAEVR